MGRSGLRSRRAPVLIGSHALTHINVFSPALCTLGKLSVLCSVPVINVEILIMAVEGDHILWND